MPRSRCFATTVREEPFNEYEGGLLSDVEVPYMGARFRGDKISRFR